jgi:ribonuclease D
VGEFQRIENAADLDALCRDLMREKVVAVDTEADSFYHYFDKTCLVQVATRKEIFLIDPLALGGPEDMQPMAKLFAAPDIRKIFHAAEYDLFVLKRDCGFRFDGLFDTMLSAQLLGYPAVGLSALVERHFEIKLPKDEQRSDWSERPLTDSQLTYAAADVAHLIALADRLERDLRKTKRLTWAEEEFETLARREWPERSFDRLGYLRIKGARNLDPIGLSVLRELYLVRDRRAREIDRPPFKVLGNRTLLEIASLRPASENALASIKGVTDLILRRFGREVLGAVERGEKKNHGPIPKGAASGGGPSRRRMDRGTERRLIQLKRWRTERARETSLDPGVLCPNAILESIAWRNPQAASEIRGIGGVKGWFAEAFADDVITALQQSDEAS